jgi:hypothetical protein
VLPAGRYQAEQERDQRPIGPGHLRPRSLTELALHDNELMAQQLRVLSRLVAAGQTRYCN